MIGKGKKQEWDAKGNPIIKKSETQNSLPNKADQFLFPFDKIRDEQDSLFQAVADAVANKRHLVIHAPTGLGKTVASLGPALKYAIDNDKTVFFLTSRHTQHVIAIETLKAIKEKFNLEFSATDIIGKKHMCIFPGMDKVPGSDFPEVCKQLREEDKCDYYTNFKKTNKPTVKAKVLADDLKKEIYHTEKLIEICTDHKMCPYEMATFLAKDSKVIIGDYFYAFSPNVRDGLLKRIEKSLDNFIIIVDEAHNLPDRLRSLMSTFISSFIMKRAIKEAKKYHFEDILGYLVGIQNILNTMSEKLNDRQSERPATKSEFYDAVKKIDDYEKMIEEMEIAADAIRTKQRFSFLSSVARFLEAWQGVDEGYVRIISISTFNGEPYVRLEYKCLDPSFVTKSVIESAHSIICMSGTLTPVNMYSDLLGFDARTDTFEFKSPFPKDNVLRLVVPDVTTKYTKRSDTEFAKMAKICSEIVDSVPGNLAIFFPSYGLRDKVNLTFSKLCKKRIYLEDSKMDKAERQRFLERFKLESKNQSVKGAVLLGAATGSFGEGIDLPGDYLKGVIIVGLPLNPPDVETKALIDYYNKQYGKGWDYAYIFPAITKCMQSAGRCIRSETDRGIIVFADERFAWPDYKRCFPPDYNMKITKDYKKEIEAFFKEDKY